MDAHCSLLHTGHCIHYLLGSRYKTKADDGIKGTKSLNMDWLLWVVRGILIVVGIILAIMIWKGKNEGRYQRINFRFLVIGITTLILGIILLVISSVTDLSLFYGLYLISVGVICIIIGLVIRKTWEKNR